MFALILFAVASASNYYAIKSNILDVDDLVYVAEYNKCVGVYDALCVTELCEKTEPLFYVIRYNNSNPKYYSDSDCKREEIPTEYGMAFFDDKVLRDVDQTYLNNNYDVKIKYNCNKNNTIDIYARTGSVTINNIKLGIYESTNNNQVYYNVQLKNKQITGPVNQCLSSGYKFEKLYIPSSSQNPSTDYNEFCGRVIPNSHIDSTLESGYPCKCNTGYDAVKNEGNSVIPFECVKNEWYAKNETCRNNHGQFAYFDKYNNKCDCENNHAIYEGYCMEGNRYCKLMSPSENVYYNENSKSCECKDKETIEKPTGEILCYLTYEEACQKLYGNAHFDAKSEYDCECNKGYTWDYAEEEGYKYPIKCVETDASISTLIILVLTLILVLI